MSFYLEAYLHTGAALASLTRGRGALGRLDARARHARALHEGRNGRTAMLFGLFGAFVSVDAGFVFADCTN